MQPEVLRVNPFHSSAMTRVSTTRSAPLIFVSQKCFTWVSVFRLSHLPRSSTFLISQTCLGSRNQTTLAFPTCSFETVTIRPVQAFCARRALDNLCRRPVECLVPADRGP